MTSFGPSVTQSVAGVQQAAAHRLQGVEKERAHEKARDRARQRDRIDVDVDRVEIADAVRSLKGNAEEETREDRESHAPVPERPVARHIDIEG